MLCARQALARCFSRSFTTTTCLSNGPKKGDRVVVGMSGGVDSSVAAMMLAKKDYDLSAVYMRNWDTRDETGTDKGCEWERDWEFVQRVCKKLDLPCEIVDLSRDYWNRVFEPSLREWEFGSSPNPDVACNREIKFGALLNRLQLETDKHESWFATGHYARLGWNQDRSRPKLLRPRDLHKDQTYFLSSVAESSLKRAVFPLENINKGEIRELAKQAKLATADRPDSVGICFVGEKAKFHDFLSSYIPQKSGPIIDQSTGKVLGEHSGLWSYTIGQRLRLGGLYEKFFVSSKDVATNSVFAVPSGCRHNLEIRRMYVPKFTWIWKDTWPAELEDGGQISLKVMHRYRMRPASCKVESENGGLVIDFNEPEESVAPGQIAVLYDNDWCLGSGAIEKTDPVLPNKQ